MCDRLGLPGFQILCNSWQTAKHLNNPQGLEEQHLEASNQQTSHYNKLPEVGIWDLRPWNLQKHTAESQDLQLQYHSKRLTCEDIAIKENLRWGHESKCSPEIKGTNPHTLEGGELMLRLIRLDPDGLPWPRSLQWALYLTLRWTPNTSFGSEGHLLRAEVFPITLFSPLNWMLFDGLLLSVQTVIDEPDVLGATSSYQTLRDQAKCKVDWSIRCLHWENPTQVLGLVFWLDFWAYFKQFLFSWLYWSAALCVVSFFYRFVCRLDFQMEFQLGLRQTSLILY